MTRTRYRCFDCNKDLCPSCITTKTPETNPHFTHLVALDSVDELRPSRASSVRELILKAFKNYGSRPLFGIPKRCMQHYYPYPDSPFPNCTSPYQWMTYDYVLGRVKDFAVGLRKLVPPGKMVGLCSSNRLEWIIADLACFLLQIVTIPIHVTLTKTEVNAIVENSELYCVVCSEEMMPMFVQIARDQPCLAVVVKMFAPRPTAPGRTRGASLTRNPSLNQAPTTPDPLSDDIPLPPSAASSASASSSSSSATTSSSASSSSSSPSPPSSPSSPLLSPSASTSGRFCTTSSGRFKTSSGRLINLPLTLMALDFYVVEEDGKKSLLANSSLDPTLKPENPSKPGDLVTIMYTSGSTGKPKGVMVPNRSWAQDLSNAYFFPNPWVEVNYEPLAHSNGRVQILEVMVRGGMVAIFDSRVSETPIVKTEEQKVLGFLPKVLDGQSHDMSLLFSDFAAIRPVQISAVPRIWNLLYKEYHTALFLALAAYQAKKKPEESKEDEAKEEQKIKSQVSEMFRSMFGNRLNRIGSGSASARPEVLKWMKDTFQANVADAYGATECGGIYVDGTVLYSVKTKLRDLPELGYLSTDKPNPRGEILVKSYATALGYYRQEELTKEVFLEDGWYATGDVGEMKPDSRLVIIGRCKAISKLQQGEYVNPAVLEDMFLESKLVDQLFILADGLLDQVVAVVVPNMTMVEELQTRRRLRDHPEPKERKYTVEQADASDDVDEKKKFDPLAPENDGLELELEQLIASDFRKIGALAKLQPYEIANVIFIEWEPFSPVNKKLTPSLKLSRAELQKCYREKLLLKAGAKPNVAPRSAHSLAALSSAQPVVSVQQLQRIIADVLGVEVDPKSTLKGFALDSFSAVKLSRGMLEKFGIDIPPTVLLNKDTNWDMLERLAQPAEKKHRPVDFDDEKTLPYSIVSQLKSGHKTKRLSFPLDSLLDGSTAGSILLTGATGFLGAHLLATLLERCSRLTAICLVRCSTVEAGLDRIISQMTKQQVWKIDYLNRLRIVIGDLERPRLGLSVEEFKQLGTELCAIYHNGANVNHAMPYPFLKECNVNSNLECLTLSAMFSPPIPLFYVSSLSSCNPEGKPLERNRLLLNSGYGQCKWVCERHLEQAFELGVPGLAFLPGSITGHSTTGCCNETDFFNRMMLTFIQLSSAPPLGGKVTLDPVDFVANAIVLLSLTVVKPQRILLSNSHSFTYKAFLDAIRSCGYPIKEFGFHQQWIDHMDSFKSSDSRPALLPFRNVLAGGLGSLSEPVDDDSQSLFKSAGISCPLADERLIRVCLQHFGSLNLISPIATQQ